MTDLDDFADDVERIVFIREGGDETASAMKGRESAAPSPPFTTNGGAGTVFWHGYTQHVGQVAGEVFPSA